MFRGDDLFKPAVSPWFGRTSGNGCPVLPLLRSTDSSADSRFSDGAMVSGVKLASMYVLILYCFSNYIIYKNCKFLALLES